MTLPTRLVSDSGSILLVYALFSSYLSICSLIFMAWRLLHDPGSLCIYFSYSRVSSSVSSSKISCCTYLAESRAFRLDLQSSSESVYLVGKSTGMFLSSRSNLADVMEELRFLNELRVAVD